MLDIQLGCMVKWVTPVSAHAQLLEMVAIHSLTCYAENCQPSSSQLSSGVCYLGLGLHNILFYISPRENWPFWSKRSVQPTDDQFQGFQKIGWLANTNTKKHTEMLLYVAAVFLNLLEGCQCMTFEDYIIWHCWHIMAAKSVRILVT